MTGIRRGGPGDLAEVEVIQDASSEAPRWRVSDYQDYDFWVALHDVRIVGFLVSRRLAEGETEVLNLAVAAEFRRQGVARELLAHLLAEAPGVIYLEVRESNGAARKLYESLGFHKVGVREKYYEDPLEPAIVMKFHSC